MNYADVIEFVKTQTAENGRPPNYEFRSRFEHTMRVYRWAIKLQSKLGGDLDIIVLAALLHDIGWDENRPHGEVGAEIAVEYLDSIGVDPEKIAKIGEIIMIHEEKDTDADLSLECRIVMDADLLSVYFGIQWLQRWRMTPAIREHITELKTFTGLINRRSDVVKPMQEEWNTISVCSFLKNLSFSWKKSYFRFNSVKEMGVLI